MPAGPAAVGWAATRNAIEDMVEENSPGELIAGRLARERIAMTNLLTGETFGRQTNVSGR